jgi:hypothetical protein
MCRCGDRSRRWTHEIQGELWLRAGWDGKVYVGTRRGEITVSPPRARKGALPSHADGTVSGPPLRNGTL